MINDKDVLVRGTLNLPNNRPSWQRFGTGYAEFTFLGHREAHWLSLTSLEMGEKSSRQTMITLRGVQVLELAQACLKTLGVPDDVRAAVTAASGKVA